MVARLPSVTIIGMDQETTGQSQTESLSQPTN